MLTYFLFFCYDNSFDVGGFCWITGQMGSDQNRLTNYCFNFWFRSKQIPF
ncbi:hypothetical protein HanIR_Chr13g0649651 [Helianthus annuus]|nr:hypothetical protein HanIR_Chr13g0649651 [Helianthus annuus]